jgi:methylthioribulose-1-phosphate dehydratase
MTLSEATDVTAELVRLGRDFYRRGWMLGTSGNLSAVVSRDPLRLAITASSVDKGRMHPGQILEVDGDGRIAADSQSHSGKPSAETLLHLEVVRSTGAAAVLHTHSVWTTVLSDFHHTSGGFHIEGYEMLKGLEGVQTHEHREWLPVVENTQDMAALAVEVRGLLAGNSGIHGLLVRRLGLYTWGKDLATAARHVEILEFLLEAVGRRQMMEPQS